MALTGVHIEFGYGSVGAVGAGANAKGLGPAALLGSETASQTMATAQASTARAPQSRPGNFQPLISIWASAPIFFVIGQNATLAQVTDGVTPRRFYDPSFGRQDMFVNDGDNIAWAFA
ncbi:hypothetical protein QA649_08935 [Bradyrhizobium sp. CB1717]|uniref:hypothetical protein n=1 Tax=Bradyrhizobium sp. CB1717 TaxID=3039154 RepID=UPI0024B047BE|nr:hypothetical protein [Bradyrhizobium sp. CB1717]WFU26315.1 hypothetical protein QA649_08935 [Bradyrhizobium sp. CB1717]